jgi:restriction endonuclease
MHDDVGRAEGDFRWRYDHVHERSIVCYNSSWECDPCANVCHCLIASDISDDGYPPVLGLDCRVSVLCWGGDDIDNSTIEAYCGDCALAQDRAREEREFKEEAAWRVRREAEKRLSAIEEQQNRTLSEYWLSLSDLEFEQQCAKVFRALGFAARTTPRTNDGGLDIILEKDGRRGAAQCKAWLAPSGVKQLREFYGALHAETMTFGYFISRGGFTTRAHVLLPNMPLITGWAIDDLVSHSRQKV